MKKWPMKKFLIEQRGKSVKNVATIAVYH